jgi:hypothetical protein
MKRILLFILIAENISCFAQIKGYSVHIGPNYTSIGNVTYTSQSTVLMPSYTGFSSYVSTVNTVHQSFDGMAGAEASGKLDYTLPGRFFLTSGLTINYLRFKQSAFIETLSGPPATDFPPTMATEGSPMGGFYFRNMNGDRQPQKLETIAMPVDKRLGKTQVWYVQVPVMVGTSFWNNRLVVRGGFTASYVVHASQYQAKYSIDYSSSTGPSGQIDVKSVNATNNFTSVSVGSILQSTYYITKNIGIDLSAQRSFSGVYKSENGSPKPKYNTFSLGVSYSFVK